MQNNNYTTSILVEQTPEVVFNAINNVSGWWSEEVTDSTIGLNTVFNYHYKNVHICKMQIVEFIPNQKVVWLVLENTFNFIKDKSEWVNTKIIFEISETGGKTQLKFTHEGLVPEYECFDICQNAWTQYIGQSLYNLITTGKGEPNPIEEVVNEAAIKADVLQSQDFTISINVDATAQEAFKCINNVTKWWTENLVGKSQVLNDEFTVQFGEVHYSKQKLVDFNPYNRVVWLVTESKLNFTQNPSEWTGTKIIFDVTEQNGKTKVQFTHEGLAPKIECYDACSNAWTDYIQGSLLKYINTRKGEPSL